jgi:hypothetical protein
MMRWPFLRGAVLVGLAALMVPLYEVILQVASFFRSQPALFFWPLLGVTIFYIAACYIVLASRPAENRRIGWAELALILGAGFILRAFFFPVPPTLSPDAFRYLFDPQMLAHGISPYTHTPADAIAAPFRDPYVWSHADYRSSRTSYPPGAQALFLLAYLLQPMSIWTWKGLVECFDLLVALLTLLLLKRHRLDPRRVVIYWWSPIPILEFAFNAHLDVAAIFWTLAALLMSDQRWRGARGVAGVFLGLATLIRLYPALYAVTLLRSRRDWPVLAGLGATVLLGYGVFFPDGVLSGGDLTNYFAPKSAIDRGFLLRWLATWVTDLGGMPNQILLAQGLALLLLCGIVGWLCWRKGLPLEAGVLAISAAWISLSTHLFTWYIALLLPLVALYLRVPFSGQDTEKERSLDRWGLNAAPALGVWLFTLLMPFSYVIFAVGYYHPKAFPYFFYPCCVLALLPLLTSRGRAAVWVVLRRSRAAVPVAATAGPARTPPSTPL